MTVYHGTDKETAKVIIKTGVLKGDWPSFRVGVCLDVDCAKNYAAVKIQKYLKHGRAFARKQLAILEFDMPETLLMDVTKESERNAYTLNGIKELKTKFKLWKRTKKCFTKTDICF